MKAGFLVLVLALAITGLNSLYLPLAQAQNGDQWERRLAYRLDRIQQDMDLLLRALNLRAEQQSAWQAFVAARRALASDRPRPQQQRFAPARPLPAPQRIAAHIERMEVRLQAWRHLARALDALYALLDAQQRAVLDLYVAEQARRRGRSQDRRR